MFGDFDSVRIINLRSRSDRRAEMRREIERTGWKIDKHIQFFDAIRPADAGGFGSIGMRGVFQSHCAVLQEAVDNDRSVLILEDDCDMTEQAKGYSLPSGWQIFYGGHVARNPDDLQNSDIMGAHMMGFSADGARQVLAYLRDLESRGICAPIDGAYVNFRRQHPEVRTFFAEPPLGFQRPSRSDIMPGAFYNRVRGVREIVGLIRRLRRAIGLRKRRTIDRFRTW